MKRIFFLLLLFLSSIAFAAGTHRIVSLSPAMTELICVLGAEEELVGRSSACDWPEQIRQLPVVGDFAKPDVEKVIALKPDIVVTNDLIQPNVANLLADHGIRVVNVQCRSLEEYKDAIITISKLIGREEEGAAELASVTAAEKGFAALPRLKHPILILIWDDPPVIAGDKTFPNELLKLAGADLPDFKGKTGYFTPNSEWLLNVQTDTLVMFKDTGAVKKHPLLKNLDAVKKGRIIVMEDPSVLQRPGPRWSLGVRILRQK